MMMHSSFLSESATLSYESPHLRMFVMLYGI